MRTKDIIANAYASIIANTIIEELKDTNANLETIKSYVRVAIKISGQDFTEEQAIEIVKTCVDGIPFNPLA